MSFNKGIHIVSFDIPFPANYGGVIDVFFKLKELHALEYKIHLHNFSFAPNFRPELDTFCEKVYYYKRNYLPAAISIRPFIVASRGDWNLIINLQANDWPILFEGLHTCYFLNHPKLIHRKKLVRIHNVEHEYYRHLAKQENNILKKIYFTVEAKKLLWFESILENAQYLLTMGLNDKQYFEKKFGDKVQLIDPFLHFKSVEILPGRGDYILYHGNLAVNENLAAVEYLIKNIFSKIKNSCIIAGNKIPKEIYQLSSGHSHIKIVDTPNEIRLQELIKNAHIHILYTFQGTGIKLKLFNALMNGRFCIANETMLSGTLLHDLCIIENTSEGMINQIKRLFDQDFSEELIHKRKEFFRNNYVNRTSAEKIVRLLE